MLKEVATAVEIFHKIAFKNDEAKKHMSDTKLGVFISVLTELLMIRYEKFWFPDEPERASGYRCIRVNRQCFDPVVASSLKRAGIPLRQHKKLICHDVTVWVDPGVVSMRIGEDGSVGHEVVDEELYAKNMAKRCSSPKMSSKDTSVESDTDEGIGSRSPSPPDTPTGTTPSTDFTPSRLTSRLRTSPPPQEYNPYAMSARVCNANRAALQRQALTPPLTSQHLSQQQHQARTISPPSNMYSANAAQCPMPRPILSQGGSLMAPPVSSGAGVYHHASGHIPVSASCGSPSFPSARRNVFAESGGVSQQDNYNGKMAPHGHYSNPMAMTYQGNHNYMDIPVMA